jgi:hypothetical protein
MDLMKEHPMTFNVNDIISKIGGNDLVKGLADKAGVGAEQAQGVVGDLLAHAKETGGNLMDSAKAIAEKSGLPLDKVEGMAAGLGATLTEKAGDLGEGAQALLTGLMGKLQDSPLGGIVKSLDKDGDGNPLNDVADLAKNKLGGLFGKKE